MEIPFNYILVNIMIVLKGRKLRTEISKQNLADIIDIITDSLYKNGEVKEEVVTEFEFDYELDKFYDENMEYFEVTYDKIILDNGVSEEELENILSDDDVDADILDKVDDMLQTNISIMELIGVKIRKDLYKWLYSSLKGEEELYGKLLLARTNNDLILEEKIIKQIKLHSFTRRLYFINLDSLDYDTLYDLSLYADDAISNSLLEKLPFHIKNDLFDEDLIYSSPFQRTLFFYNSPIVYSSAYKLDNYLNNEFSTDLKFYAADYKFYLNYYYLLCKEIDTLPESKLKQELIITKYRLMMQIDNIFDNTLFMNIDNSDIEKYDGPFGFNKLETLFFVDEILSYNDKMYQYNDSYVVEYFNVVKKIFIKTYYSLTKDNDVVKRITENKFYGVNKTSSKYFDDILNIPRRRIK